MGAVHIGVEFVWADVHHRADMAMISTENNNKAIN